VPASDPQDVARLIEDSRNGSQAALDTLLPLVYAELHRVARGYLSRQQPGHTLQPTALVNEAYLKLVGQREQRWQNRAHFVAVAAQSMRHIMVDHFRRRHYQKRGGDAVRVTLDDSLAVAPDRSDEVVALDEALTKLAAQDARKARIAELRYFGGLSVEETAEVLSVSPATVVREWKLTKAWLERALSER
jgi:RNA polymerase sigma-70 factor (ECF subfamily)